MCLNRYLPNDRNSDRDYRTFLFAKYFKVARVDFLSLNILLSQVNIYNFGVIL